MHIGPGTDDDGVCVVPRESASDIASAGREREEHETEKRARFSAGELSLDIYNMRGPLEDAGLKYVDSAEDLND